MPDPRKMMFIRPRNCRYCGNGYYGMGHVIDYARQKGFWIISSLEREQANKEPIYSAMDEHDPESVFGFGHGNETTFTADAEQPIFTVDECNKLSGRITYLLSCLTAIHLGPAIIANGGRAYAGFDISWAWMTETGTDTDPYQDRYARGFWESANEVWIALLDGQTITEAAQRSVDKYNEWIDYWIYENPGDPYSEEAIGYLAADRDALTILGDLSARLTITEPITEGDCLTEGYYWWSGACHTYPPLEPEEGFNWLSVIPVIAIVGITYILETR